MADGLKLTEPLFVTRDAFNVVGRGEAAPKPIDPSEELTRHLFEKRLKLVSPDSNSTFPRMDARTQSAVIAAAQLVGAHVFAESESLDVARGAIDAVLTSVDTQLGDANA